MKRQMRRKSLFFPITVFLCLLTMLSVVNRSLAQVRAVPFTMNFQGRLSRPDNTPVADGTYTLRFSLHTAPTGGTELWNETNTAISVKNGAFAAFLNFATGFQNGATAGALFDANMWLEIKIGNEAPLTPRQFLHSVAFAMKADKVKDGAITSDSLANGAVTANKLANDAVNNLAWGLAGNGFNNPMTQFLGTTSNHPLVFRTNNSEKIRLTPEGYLGIGTATPRNPLSFPDAFGEKISLYGEGDNFGFGVQNGLLQIHSRFDTEDIAFGNGNSVLFKEKMRIKGNGRVGIGTNAPIDVLTVSGFGTAISAIDRNVRTRLFSNQNNNMGYIGTSSTHPLAIRTSDVDRLIIAATGNVGVKTNPSLNTALVVEGSGNTWSIFANGNIGTTGGYFSNSDARYKKNVATVPNALETILNLRGVTYDWRREEFKDRAFSEGQQVGFIAQEVEKVLPQLVRTDDHGYKAVNYTNLVPVLVEAIKTLNAKVESLKRVSSENTELRAKNAALEARLSAIEQAITELKGLKK